MTCSELKEVYRPYVPNEEEIPDEYDEEEADCYAAVRALVAWAIDNTDDDPEEVRRKCRLMIEQGAAYEDIEANKSGFDISPN